MSESKNEENRRENFSKVFILMSLSFVLLSATVSRHSELKQLILEQSQKLNLTPFLNHSILVFNRVPKVSQVFLNFSTGPPALKLISKSLKPF